MIEQFYMYIKTKNKSNKYHTVGKVPKYHTVGTGPKYHTVGTGPKYHTLGTGLKSNRNIVERGKINIHVHKTHIDCSIS